MNKQLERTLALAGIFQAANLVSELAYRGYADDKAFSTSLSSLLKLESKDTLDVYGSVAGVTIGLTTLISTLSARKSLRPNHIIRYVLSLMHLERKLIVNKPMCTKIEMGIKRAQAQAEYLSLTHQNVIANLANVYTDTLSTFSFRIQVVGEPIYLNRLETLHKIRALLLAGVRSSVLWRQLGGSRLQLVFARRRTVKDVQALLERELIPH